MPSVPYIPRNITVHLGAPDSNAENVTVSFAEYVKNAASSEIYPTWPENALRANIYAIISYALNRVYTEWYRSRGYNFDITSSTAYDMSFVNGRNIFEDISRIVDEIFNNYIRRMGNIEPLFAAFCDGIKVRCNGLWQWGTVDLANEGYIPYNILTYYYGDDIEIVTNAPVQDIAESYPGSPLKLGSPGQNVQLIQLQLNRISTDYPNIPKIAEPDGFFGVNTEEAVKEFQRTFNLAADGIVGKATWYKIKYIFVAVTDLAELESEGLELSDIPKQPDRIISFGDRGSFVRALQYYLATAAYYNNAVPPVVIDGIFGAETQNALLAFEREYGLEANGALGEDDWNKLSDVYLGILRDNPPDYLNEDFVPYPGSPLRLGSSGDAVLLLQERLNLISDFYGNIPKTGETGYFGADTQRAVLAFEREFGLPQRGIVLPFEWERIAQLSQSLEDGALRNSGQYPGYVLKI